MNSLRLARALIAGCFALLAAGAPASAQTTAAAPPPASAGPVDPALLEDLVTAKQVPAVRADRSIGRALSSILRGTLGSARAAHPQRPPRSVEARAKTPIGRPDRAPRSECWSEVENFRVAVCGAAPGAGS